MKNQPKFYKTSILLIITLLAGCGEKPETVGQMKPGDANNTVVSSNQSHHLSTYECPGQRIFLAKDKVTK